MVDMTIGEAGSILELKCFEVVGPTSVGFVDLCTELRNEINEIAMVVVAYPEDHNEEEQKAAVVWLDGVGSESERSRVLEEMALEWMTADEQIEEFGDSDK